MTDSLEAIALRPSIIRKNWLPLKMAVQEVLAFEQRFGKKHLLLACHAALPSYLTPELLNLVRLNFLDNENIATIAEADFLLSPLCRPVDERLFEVEPAVREVLLVSLKRQYGKEEGEKRLVDLAAFLRRYLAEKSHQITRSDVLNTMRWIASSYLEPDFVIQELRKQFDESLSDATDVNEALIEQAELVVLLEKVAEPLERSPMQQEYQYLMHDSHVVAQMLYTDEPTDEVFAASEKGVHKGKLASLISPSLLNWIVASAPPISDERVIEPASIVEPVTPITIDSEVERLLSLAGWTIQNYDSADIRAKRGVAIRNLPIRSATDEAQSVDYLLFVDQQAAGIVKVIKQRDDHNLPESPTKRNVLETNLDHLIETVTLQLQPQPRAQATASTLQQLSTFIPNDVTLADLVVGWRTLSHSAQNEEEEIATTRRRSTCGELADIASQFMTEQGNIEQAIKTWRIWHNAFENSDNPRQVAMANTFARELSELETASQVIFIIEDGENRISLEKPTRLSQSIPMLDGEKLRLNFIPFTYETNTLVSRVRFTNYLDPTIRTRSVFAFHRPETLGLWLQQAPADVAKSRTDLLRARLRGMPELSHSGLRDVQYNAIISLEKSLADNRQRALIQIATGSGKTGIVLNIVYRLLKFGNARRILYVTDRNVRLQQIQEAFERYIPPDGQTERRFVDIYKPQYLSDISLDRPERVYLGTVQQLHTFFPGQESKISLPSLTEEDHGSIRMRQDAIVTTKTFVKSWKQIPKSRQRVVAEKINFLVQNRLYPSLNVHRIVAAGAKNMWVCNVGTSLRLLYQYQNDTIYLLDVGTRSVINKSSSRFARQNDARYLLDVATPDDLQDDFLSVSNLPDNPSLPIDAFDVIIIDDCTRFIIDQPQLRSVLEYFDAFLIGLAEEADPNIVNFFNDNVVYKQLPEIVASIKLTHQVDICIFCVLAEEVQALKEAFEEVLAPNNFQQFYSAHLNCEYDYIMIKNINGAQLGVLVTWSPYAGPVEVSLRLYSFVEEFKPSFVAMTGTCTGDKEKVKLGDIIVADRAFLYDTGKMVQGEDDHLVLSFNNQMGSPPTEVIQAVRDFNTWKSLIALEQGKRPISKHQQRDWLLNTLFENPKFRLEDEMPPEVNIPLEVLNQYAPDWKKLIRELQEGPDAYLTQDRTLNRDKAAALRYGKEDFPFKDSEQPTVYIAPIASGSAIRAANPFEQIRMLARGVVAIDIESETFYSTMREFNKTHYLLVKGVSDYGDGDKDDSYREYAAKVSALYLLAFLREYVTTEHMDLQRSDKGVIEYKRTVPTTASLSIQNIQEELNLFCCYAPEDENFLRDLEKHLIPLTRHGGPIKEWYTSNITGGSSTNATVFLERSQIILLLISADFIANDDLYEKQLMKAFEMQKEGRAHVVPILLRPIELYGTPLEESMVLPRNLKPISQWKDRDEAFHQVSQEIRAIAANFKENQT